MKRKKAVLIGVVCAALVLLLMFAGLTYYSYKTPAPSTPSHWTDKGFALDELGRYEEPT
jgi:hypothetical protein